MKNLLVIAILSILFIGCGSDKDDSSYSSSFAFPTDSVKAEPTIENGEKVRDEVAQDQESIYVFNSVSSTNSKNVALTMKKIHDILKENIELDYYSLNEILDGSFTCSGGGMLDYRTTLVGLDEISIRTTFNNCTEYSITTNGAMNLVLSDYEQSYDDFTKATTTFITDFTTIDADTTLKILKGSTISAEYSNFIDYYEAGNMKMTISAIIESGSTKSAQENSVYHFSNINNATSMYQTFGKIYINNLISYVDYDTSYNMSQTPFVFNYFGALESGEARYIMANGAKVKIVVEGTQAVVYIDANNDGIYELSN